MADTKLTLGSRIRVSGGRWKGCIGTLVGFTTTSGPGQPSQDIPVVDLDVLSGNPRRVQVLAVEAAPDEHT